MSTLHQLLSGSSETWRDCRSASARNDGFLLVDDGVRALAGPAFESAEPALTSGRVFALEADVAARGLRRMADRRGVRLVSDQEWVELLRTHTHVLSWK